MASVDDAYQGINDDESEKLLPYASHFHARGGCKDQMQSRLIVCRRRSCCVITCCRSNYSQ